ncbi:putative serine/threonine-protein kinase FMP48 [Spathaspora sp. JA1]|nr:putative serine/threonine-protein kinase FMP48 [Spathaspora sp. JA1]
MSKSYKLYETNQIDLNGKYKFIKHIQTGSFGKVSLARDITNDSLVSLKSMKKTKKSIDIAENEILVLRKLKNHDNICQLLDSFELHDDEEGQDYIFLVLEYCSRGDLYDLIHEHCLTDFDIMTLANQIGSAIKYIHSQGVYHRDIKPENILINNEGQFKLCDWGLATTIRFNDEFGVGTEKYMAPECLLKKSSNTSPTNDQTSVDQQYLFDNYDCKYADYWSFGITILSSIFGTSPFKSGKNKSITCDYNFKNFVHLNKSHILYDIYPSMNFSCFEMIMNLLRVGNDEDELEVVQEKISQRSIDRFIDDMNDSWKFGFVEEVMFDMEDDDDEDDFKVKDEESQAANTATTTATTVATTAMGTSSSAPVEKSIKVDDSSNLAVINYDGVDTHTTKLPSLVQSSYQSSKSWCDIIDNDDFTIEYELAGFDQLHLTDKKKDKVTIVEHELWDESVVY